MHDSLRILSPAAAQAYGEHENWSGIKGDILWRKRLKGNSSASLPPKLTFDCVWLSTCIPIKFTGHLQNFQGREMFQFDIQMPIHWWLASWTFFYPEPIQLSLRVQMVSINDKLTDEPTCLDAAFWCCLKRWSKMAPYSSWIRCISFMCSATWNEGRKLVVEGIMSGW